MKRYRQYVKDVKSRKILACKNLKLAVARFERDLAESKAKTSPWIFDEDEADRLIDFLECLVQYEEPFTGQEIVLQDWQCFFLGQLYGWRHRETGIRRFKKAMLFMGRKQGKTTIASGLTLYELMTKPGIQAYSLATKQEIANIALDNIKAYIEESEELSAVFRAFAYHVTNTENRSVFRPLSSDRKLDGKNPAYVIIDELSSHDNAEAYHALTSGMGTRSEPLTVIITTAGYGLDNPMIEEYSYGTDILSGAIKDDSYLVAIYEYDKGDKWDDLSKLQKSCPSLGVTAPLEYYETQVLQAQRVPSLAGEYKVKYCNTWEARDNTWIHDKTWTDCVGSWGADKPTDEEIAEAPSVVALDFSTIFDWTVATRYTWIERLGKYATAHRFYIPEGQVDTKTHLENPSIKQWISDGIVTATPGEVIDYSYIYADLYADLDAYRILVVTFDPAKSKEFQMEFSSRDELLMPFLQNSKSISPAAKSWEKAVLDKAFVDTSPVMRWMLSNAVNRIHKDSGSYFIAKASSTSGGRKRIDGVITSLMAFSVLRDRIAAIADAPKIFDLSKIQY
jgi:phage terminase large subunit-like protein